MWVLAEVQENHVAYVIRENVVHLKVFPTTQIKNTPAFTIYMWFQIYWYLFFTCILCQFPKKKKKRKTSNLNHFLIHALHDDTKGCSTKNTKFQVLTFDNLDTFPNFDNFDLNLNKSWIYMEIFWDLGLLLLSPPGAAPLRQSRCSVKAELSSSSSIFQPEHFPVQTGFANCVWRSNTLWVETEIQNYKYDL